MTFNKEKCRVPYFRKEESNAKYRIENNWLGRQQNSKGGLESL